MLSVLKGVLTATLIALSQSASANAQRFDYYLLALSLAPAFCEDDPAKKQRLHQCRTLVARSGSTVPAVPALTLHGLWPNNTRQPHPAYCAGERDGSFCRLPQVALPITERARVLGVMPGAADCLDRHQWHKHGSCSGLAPTAYFQWAVALTTRVERALGETLRRHQGSEVAIATLVERLRKSDPALAGATSFHCRTPRTSDPRKRRPMLTEVRVQFARAAGDAPGKPLPLSNAGRRNSGCPGGRAWVDAPDD